MFAAVFRKRGYWWAVCAGLIAHFVALFALLALYWLLRPFVWAAVYGVPYSASPGPLDPNSGEWLFAQGISVLSWFAAGAASTRWSTRGFPWAPATLVLVTTVLLIWARIPTNASAVRIAIYVAGAAVGLISGGVIYVLFSRTTKVTKAVHGT